MPSKSLRPEGLPGWRGPIVGLALVLLTAVTVAVASAASLGGTLTTNSLRVCAQPVVTAVEVTSGSHSCS